MSLLSKKLTAVALALSAVVIFNACGKTSPPEPTSADQAPQKTQTPLLEYRIRNANCDTHRRTFILPSETCENLQLSFNNNNCAEEERRLLFLDNCGQRWNPAVAESSFINANNVIQLDCELTEAVPGEDGVVYTVKQSTISRSMKLAHNHVWAKVTQKYNVVSETDLSQNTWSISMTIWNQNTIVASINDNFKGNSARAVTLSVKDQFRSSLVCTPTNKY